MKNTGIWTRITFNIHTLEINMKKTQYMTIGNDYDITTYREVLQKTTEYNYLGVHLNEIGKANKDILKKVEKTRA